MSAFSQKSSKNGLFQVVADAILGPSNAKSASTQSNTGIG